jgi:putative Holliday junction resolvase
MGRSAAVDYGTRRIGLALSDYDNRIASPAQTLAATGDPNRDARALAIWAIENEATTLVVGLPLNMNGTSGPQAELSRRLAEALRREAPDMRIELWDERLSSFQADEILAQAQASRSKRKRLRDALAAQVILQAYLDAHGREEAPR